MFIKREWATPWVIGAFLLSGVTGITLFFKVNTQLGQLAHEYLGLVFIVAILTHLVPGFLNVKRYFRSPKALVIIGVYALILLATFVPFGPPKQSGDKNTLRLFLDAAMNAPLQDVAKIVGRDPNDLIKQLQANGYDIKSPSESIIDSSGSGPTRQLRGLSAISIIMGQAPPTLPAGAPPPGGPPPGSPPTGAPPPQ